MPAALPDTALRRWVARHTPPGRNFVATPMPGAGSAKVFWRLNGEAVLMVNDHPETGLRGLTENDSFLHLHAALTRAGAPVPALYGAWPRRGAFLLQDLGQTALMDVLSRPGPPPMALLRRVVSTLAMVQVRGRALVDPQKLHNDRYDAAFVRQRESGYFTTQWLQGVLGETPSAALEQELDDLARRAGEVPGDMLLYRDFQSSNILLSPGGGLGLIDFQGARPGPPHYDLASLVYDAYTNLSPAVRRELAAHHQRCLWREGAPRALLDRYDTDLPLLAAHRAMQAVGAFAKLSRVDGKTRFARWLPVMLERLGEILEHPALAPAKTLRAVVKKAAVAGR